MTSDEASKRIVAGVYVTPEDVARAKDYIPAWQDWETKSMLNTEALGDHWLGEQVGTLPREIIVDAASAPDECDRYARAYSLRLAFFQAVWDLLNAGVLMSVGSVVGWNPRPDARHSHGGQGLSLERISSWYTNQIARAADEGRRPTAGSRPVPEGSLFPQAATRHRGGNPPIPRLLPAGPIPSGPRHARRRHRGHVDRMRESARREAQ
jgi:hypothetical protein